MPMTIVTLKAGYSVFFFTRDKTIQIRDKRDQTILFDGDDKILSPFPLGRKITRRRIIDLLCGLSGLQAKSRGTLHGIDAYEFFK